MNRRLLKSSSAELEVAADLARRGYGVALPTSHGMPFDLILVRPDWTLEKVQVKHERSNGEVVRVKCASTSAWVQYSYDAGMIDWLAVWDETTDACFYVPILEAARRELRLRLTPARNGQQSGIRWAESYRSI